MPNFEIVSHGILHYIKNDSGFLHKDGTIHEYCGEENFFESRKEAETFLDSLESSNDGFLVVDDIVIAWD